MTRILTIFLFLFLAFTIYYDLTTGSLPAKSIQPHQEVPTAEATIDFTHVLVQPGDTVLSIYEHLLDGKENTISIAQLIDDFEALNPSTKASQIKIGVTYKFPLYSSS